MPLGDSITYGLGSSDFGGYRSRLFHLALVNHQAITFVGGRRDGPATVDGVPFPMDHEGSSGYHIADIAGLAAQQVARYTPRIVLLMIGTNDMDRSDNVDTAPARLGKLMDLIIQTAPTALLVVGTVTPARDGPTEARVITFNAAIPGMVASRAQAGAHITMVDTFAALATDPNFATTQLGDYVHPNNSGYDLIARAWYAKVGSLFPPK